MRGNSVKLTVRLRGRELTKLSIAQQQLDVMIRNLHDVAKVVTPHVLKGKMLTAVVVPLPSVMQQLRDNKKNA